MIINQLCDYSKHIMSAASLCVTLAPFTLAFGCGFSTPNPTRASQWESLGRRRGLKFRSSADPPLEVVPGPYYWRTEPVWMDKPASRIEGDSIGWSINYTGSSLNLIQRNVQQSKVTCPNNSNVVTVTVCGNLHKERELHKKFVINSLV